MRHWTGVVCLASVLAAFTASADILPAPDRGPPMGSAGGLDFAIQSVQVQMHGYSKTVPVVVLVGCTDGQPNCALARSRHLIGMLVQTVDGQQLQPRIGRVQQIIDAFGRQEAGRPITFVLYERGSNDQSVTVAFARR